MKIDTDMIFIKYMLHEKNNVDINIILFPHDNISVAKNIYQ